METLAFPDVRLVPDRRPIRAIALYNGYLQHPRGLNPRWTGGGVPWLIDTMNSAYLKGFRRFMWSLPAGRKTGESGPWPSAQWQLLDYFGIYTPSGSVRLDLQELVRPWLAHRPDAKVIVYLGGVITNPNDLETTGAWVPDPDSEADRKTMHANFDGFATALWPQRKPSWMGFWLDSSSPPEKRDAEYKVIQWLRSNSFWGGMEAVANDGAGAQDRPNQWFVNRVPMLGIRQFWEPVINYTETEPPPGVVALSKARAEWTFDRQRSEVGFFIHEFSVDKPHGLTIAQGWAKLQQYHDRGCVLGTYVERWEDTILSIVSG